MRLWNEVMEYRESCNNLLWSEVDGHTADREFNFLLSALPEYNRGSATEGGRIQIECVRFFPAYRSLCTQF